MPAITSPNVSQAIPKFVAVDFLDALMPNMVMAGLVNRNFDSTLANAGDAVNIPIPPVLIANNLVESGTVQPQNPSLGNAQVVLDSHLEVTIVIPDITAAITQPSLMALYMKPAVIAAASQIESDLLNVYPLLTANAPVGGASPMDESRLDAAETTLFNALVPDAETRYLILAGTSYGQTRQLPIFEEYAMGVNRDQASPVQTGRLAGAVKGFNVFRSQMVPRVGGTTYNLAFTRDAITLVSRTLPLPDPGTGAVGAYASLNGFGVRVVHSYNPSTLSNQFTVDCFYGVGVMRNNFAVIVETN